MRTQLVILFLGCLFFSLAAADRVRLAAAVADKERAMRGLAAVTRSLHENRCNNMAQCRNSISLCSVPACGDDFPTQMGFHCRNDFGTDPVLCGPDCAGLVRSTSQTTVFLPSSYNSTQRRDGEVEAFICASNSLTQVFNYEDNNQTLNSWAYIAHTSGAFRMYPGLPNSRGADGCFNFDPRTRPWYQAATQGPKDIVVIIDVTQSMNDLVAVNSTRTKLDVVKDIVRQLASVLDEDDYFGFIIVGADVNVFSYGGDPVLLKGTEDSKSTLLSQIDMIPSMGDSKSSYLKAFQTAFSLLSSGPTSDCSQTILFMTDSPSIETATQVNTAISAGQAKLKTPAGIIFYGLSSKADSTLINSIACANNGFAIIKPLQPVVDPFSYLGEYYDYMAWGTNDGFVRWSNPYMDAFGAGQMVTASIPVYDSDNKLVSVIGADIPVTELQELGAATNDQVLAALASRSGMCKGRMSICELSKFRAKYSVSCPNDAALVIGCQANGNYSTPTPGAATCPVRGDINDYLCSPLAFPSMLTALTDLFRTTAEVSCCTRDTCPAELWRAPDTYNATYVSTNCDVPMTLFVIVTQLSPSLNLGLTRNLLDLAVPSFLRSQLRAQYGCNASYFLIDSQGSPTVALSAYISEIITNRGLTENNASSSTRVVLIVQDSKNIADAFSTSLSPTIPIISSWAADTTNADALTRPSTVRLLPPLNLQVGVMLDAVNALKWDSVAIVYSSNIFAANFALMAKSAFETVGEKGTAPIIMSMVQISSTFLQNPSVAADDAVLNALAFKNPVGIIAVVSAEELKRLVAARNRHRVNNPNSVISKFFFLMMSDAVDGMGDDCLMMTVPFAKPRGFPEYVPLQSEFGIGTRLQLSVLLDALRLGTSAMPNISVASSLIPLRNMSYWQRLLQVSFVGYTGTVSIDPQTLSRQMSTFKLSFMFIPATQDAAWWSRATGFVALPAARTGVPASPLKAVTVCVLSGSACHDIANTRRILNILKLANERNDYFVNNTIVITPIVMNANEDVRGMRLILPVAAQCNFVTGPGKNSVGFALTPIINAYQIPQIEFSATSVAYSDKISYPFFSRVISDDQPISHVFAEVVSNFQWGSVILVTTRDLDGQAIAAAYADQLATKLVDIESTFLVSLTGVTTEDKAAHNAQMWTDVLTTIRDTSISRIVLVMVPSTLDVARAFYQTVVRLSMQQTHIFVLHSSLCQVGNGFPDLRAPLVGSICVAPMYNVDNFAAVEEVYRSLTDKDRAAFDALLKQGELNPDTCDPNQLDVYTSFATDAAQLLVEVVKTALVTGVSLLDGPTLTSLIRNTSLAMDLNQWEGNLTALRGPNGTVPTTYNPITKTWTPTQNLTLQQLFSFGQHVAVTGNITLNSIGNRLQAKYTANIQQSSPTAVVTFASWSNTGRYELVPASSLPYGPLRWLDNTTKVPKFSIRSIKFILATTGATHPGAIALSIGGFLFTIFTFFCCYKVRQSEDEDGGSARDIELGGVAAPSKQES
jgi:hypothetical protein